MLRSALRTFAASELCLLAGLAICVWLLPAGLSANDGASYYGVHINTIVPYTLGLLAAGYFAWRAARILSMQDRLLSRVLYCFGPLYLGIAITPYSAGPIVDWTHTILGALLFIIQLIVAGYVAFVRHRDWLNITLFVVQLAGGIVSAIYLAPSQGYLLQGQVLFQLAFGLLMIRTLAQAA